MFDYQVSLQLGKLGPLLVENNFFVFFVGFYSLGNLLDMACLVCRILESFYGVLRMQY